jgi:CxxC motif-containing protein (DUF1111 family)
MHDGQSITVEDAIRRHSRESEEVRERFFRMKASEQKDVLAFLSSL